MPFGLRAITPKPRTSDRDPGVSKRKQAPPFTPFDRSGQGFETAVGLLRANDVVRTYDSASARMTL
jgi:hypothetical protein